MTSNPSRRKRVFTGLAAFSAALLITLGVFASNDWLPKTDPLTGNRSGWFGKPLAANAPSSWNPIASVMPSPTPTPLPLAKEYLYAGSRMLAVEDANATAAPPADIAIWRPSSGEWYVMQQSGTNFAWAQWGIASDTPVPGDYDGDGKTDFAVFRSGEGTWYIIRSSDGSYQGISWGAGGKPVPADYDGDGRTDAAVAKNNSTTNSVDWLILASGGGSLSGSWGLPSDLPGAADFDGDGRADSAVFRTSSQDFYWFASSTGAIQGVHLGSAAVCTTATNCIVASDFDGDGKADPAIHDSETSNWRIHSSTTGQATTTQWGSANSVPVHNDYDLDGKTDLAVWKATACGIDAVWTIKRSSNGTTRTEYWGCPNDIPVPAFYRR